MSQSSPTLEELQNQLQQTLQAIQTQASQQIESLSAESAKLDAELFAKRDSILQVQSAEKQVRNELATRLQKADDRDKALNAREARIHQEEKLTQANSDLLNL